MCEVIKNHWIAIILAFIVGLIIVLPNFTSIYKTENFSGIYPMFNDDESYYLGITKEVYDGHYNSGNTFIKEHKERPALQVLFFEAIPAIGAKLLGFSVPELFVFNDFLLPFFGVILLYILIFSITGYKYISSILSFLFYFMFLASFNRPISPQLGFLVFLLGIFLVWKIVSKRHNIKTFLLLNAFLAAIFSSLVYIYPFYWTAIIVLYVISFLILIVKEGEFTHFIKGFGIFSLISAFLLLPYGLSVLKAIGDPAFMEASMRNGLVFTHWPGAFFNVAFILFCFPIVYLLGSQIKDKKELLFCYSLILSGTALNWQNVITGKILQFSSHYYMITIFFIFLIFSILGKNILDSHLENERWDYKKFIASFLATILVLVIIFKQKNEPLASFQNILSPPDISKIQNLMPTLSWLSKNTLPDSAIYVLGDDYDTHVPVYTESNLYRSGYAGMSLVSDDELENRWIIQNFWSDINAETVKGNHRSIWINKFQDTYANKEVRRKILKLITGKKYPESVLVEQRYIDRVLEKSSQFKKAGFEKALKTFEADYIILDTGDSRYRGLEEQFKKYSFLQNITRIGETIIYKVN